ncbi:MAG: hypothetical protein EOO41_01890 [Methanobacteriota archaeon]|nr:MAG: hypothetical protein EOO41_01890 [Euryarchaeota archaeon]
MPVYLSLALLFLSSAITAAVSAPLPVADTRALDRVHDTLAQAVALLLVFACQPLVCALLGAVQEKYTLHVSATSMWHGQCDMEVVNWVVFARNLRAYIVHTDRRAIMYARFLFVACTYGALLASPLMWLLHVQGRVALPWLVSTSPAAMFALLSPLLYNTGQPASMYFAVRNRRRGKCIQWTLVRCAHICACATRCASTARAAACCFMECACRP